MSLKIGIVGLPNVGKSTLFQALTHKQVDTSNYPFATIEPNTGIVEVKDARVDVLANLSKSAKRIPAVIEFVDIAGLVKGASQGEGLGNQFLSHIREVDAIVEVVRAFENPNVIHVESSVDPERDRGIIETELIMADLATTEKAVARLEKEAKAGGKEAKVALENAKKMKELLGRGDLLPKDLWEEARSISLLTAKPIFYLYNITGDIPPKPDVNKIFLNIKLEEEISQMPPEELLELGVESHLPAVSQTAYSTLNLISFFTTGEDETRAWTILAGSTAKRAGRAIHSDFEEKFIRAEIIFWEDLIKTGSYAKARELGLLRTEGKDYVVKDGDVIEFKI